MRLSTFALVLVSISAACARTETPGPAADNPPATTASANGDVGSSLIPRDSISERADRGRIMGDESATVWFIMASDFQCPFCKTWHDQAFNGLMQEYAAKNKVRMAFINLPLSMHRNAMPAAEAAMCASVQNKFWPMHDAIFMTQKRWENMPNATPVFDSLATAAGVNMTLYRQCYTQHLTVPLIQADAERVRRAGAQSTPTFFVGDQMMLGADAKVREAIEAALAKAAKKPAN